MNILRKIYCRAFQGVFRLAIPILPYRTPIQLDSVSKVGDLLISKGIKRVLIVTDEFLSSGNITSKLLDALSSGDLEYFIFDKTVPNPTTDNVEAARRLYLDNKCEGIIGFGGGSSIDCAKAVGARIARPKKSISDMEGILKVCRKTPFTAAIPTTAGTGSETTLATVITDSETRHKFPINDFALIPDAAVLDPEITRTLPPHLTAATGMDALTHAVEAYIGRSTVGSTRSVAIAAIKLIFENIETAYSDGDNMKARENMLNAAFLAGNAFSKSYVGYCHAVAHSLGGRYNTPHGLANAVILPYVLESYGSSAHKKLKKLAVEAGLCSSRTDDAQAATVFIQKIKELSKNLDIPQKLSGISPKDIPKLAKYADKEANPLYPVPKLMSDCELEKFYYDIMEEV